MSILAVGTVAFDSIETPFGSADLVLGGSATYITLAARYFCDDVRLSAVVGGDFPAAYIDTLHTRGVDLEGLKVDEQGKTFAWAGRYHNDLNVRDTLATHLNVLASFEPVVPKSYRDSRIVCLGNLDPTIQLSVLDQLDHPMFVVCDTMNYWIDNTPDSLRETLKRVDCLIINDAEARQLSEEANLVKAARHIQQMGPKTLVIKKGEHGALLFTETDVFSAPALPLDHIQDPTGAGDTFAGGFVGYLAHAGKVDDDYLRQAVIFGSTMASYAVERFGPDRLLDLTSSEIQERVEAFRQLSAFPPISRLFT